MPSNYNVCIYTEHSIATWKCLLIALWFMIPTFLNGLHKIPQRKQCPIIFQFTLPCTKMLAHCPLVYDTKIPEWFEDNTSKKNMSNYFSVYFAMTSHVLDEDEGGLDDMWQKSRKGLRESQELWKLQLLQSDRFIERRRVFKICYKKKKIHFVLDLSKYIVILFRLRVVQGQWLSLVPIVFSCFAQ